MTEAVNQEPSAQDIWNEEAAKRDDSTAAEAAASSATQTPDPAIDDAIAATEAANTDPASADTQTADSGEPATASDQTTQFLEELRQRFEKIESRQRNVEGHIGGLKTAQQKLLETMEAARAATADAPTQKQLEQAAANSEKWNKLKSEFPEWAEATEELLSARLAPAAAIDPTVFERQLDERLNKVIPELREQMTDIALEGAFPGWKDEVKTDAFKTWFEKSPAEIKALADSPHVGDAARMLRLYEISRQSDPSRQLANERQNKLANAVALPKGKQVPATKTVDQMNEQELWEYYAKQRERQRQKELGL